MRKMLIPAVAGVALLVALPASALARHHHRHHSRTHHARVRHLRFGHTTNTSGTTTTGSSDTAGKVASFDGTTLTIKLNDGSTVAGKVTPDTEIECPSSTSSTSTTTPGSTPTPGSTMHEDGDGGGDHSGSSDSSTGSGPSGTNEQGDDNGDQGDQGDQGGQNSCTNALTQNPSVQEAELNVSSAGAVWKKVELAG